MSERKVWDVLAEAEEIMNKDWLSGESKLFHDEQDYLKNLKAVLNVLYRLKLRDPEERRKLYEGVTRL